MESGRRITFFLGKLGLGGVERVLLTYANELAKREFKVTFLVAKGEGAIEDDLSEDVELIRFEETRVRKAWGKLWKYIHKNKPDYIITGGDAANIMVIIASLFSRTKVIISQHNYNDVEALHQGLWSHCLHTLMRLFYPKAYKILAVSQGIADYLINDVRINRKHVDILYNPIDIKELEKKSLHKTEVEVPENYILFVGRVSPVKNLSLLLNAYDQSDINDASLVIVGDGSDVKRLKEQRDGLNRKNNIIFTGLSHDPIPYIARCKALVLCSYSEAMPVVLLEAMAFDKPIIATPTPGAKEILAYRDGTFISTSFDNIDEFAHLLEVGSRYGKTNLSKYAKQYDMETIIGQLCGLLK